MNGKVSRKLRQIAKTKAHSWKETTTKGAKATQIPEILLKFVDSNATNIKNGIFFQRKLDNMSVGAITNKMKKIWKETHHDFRKEMYSLFETILDVSPEMLGVSSKVST